MSKRESKGMYARFQGQMVSGLSSNKPFYGVLVYTDSIETLFSPFISNPNGDLDIEARVEKSVDVHATSDISRMFAVSLDLASIAGRMNARELRKAFLKRKEVEQLGYSFKDEKQLIESLDRTPSVNEPTQRYESNNEQIVRSTIGFKYNSKQEK